MSTTPRDSASDSAKWHHMRRWERGSSIFKEPEILLLKHNIVILSSNFLKFKIKMGATPMQARPGLEACLQMFFQRF